MTKQRVYELLIMPQDFVPKTNITMTVLFSLCLLYFWGHTWLKRRETDGAGMMRWHWVNGVDGLGSLVFDEICIG